MSDGICNQPTIASVRSGALRTLVATALFALICVACGGGGSGPAPTTYTLSGRVQKGPLQVGSQVSVSVVDTGLNPTGTVFNVQTTDAVGDFSVGTPIASNLVQITAQGYYLDELTGQVSAAPITLSSYTDLSVNSKPTVNALTTLQAPRLKALVSKGAAFGDAATQSMNEVLALFGIDGSKVQSLTTLDAMRVDGNSDSDSALLAASAILAQAAATAAQANQTTQAAELSSLINRLGSELASTGTVSDSTWTAELHAASAAVDTTAVASNLSAYYARNGVTVTLPTFAEWIDPSASGDLPQRRVAVTGLAFAPVTGALPGTTVTSATYTVAGISAGTFVPVTVGAGETIIKNGTAQTGSVSAATAGDTLALRLTAPGYALGTAASITVGATSATWSVASAPLSGTISGLSGSGLMLSNSTTGENITIAAGATSFAFNQPVQLGAAFSVVVQKAPSSPVQGCTVNQGSGTAGSAQVPPSITCSTAQEQLLAFVGYNSWLTLVIDPATGALSQGPGSPLAATTGDVSVDPTGHFVLWSDTTAGLLTAYTVGSDGSFLPAGAAQSVPKLAGGAPVIDSSGHYVYVLSNGNSLVGGTTYYPIYGYALAPGSGILTPLPWSPYQWSDPQPFGGVSLATATANFLYIAISNVGEANGNTNSIGASGALSPTGAGTSGCILEYGVYSVDPTGHYLYSSNALPNISSSNPQSCAIDPVSGALTSVVNNLTGLTGGSLALVPGGQYGYGSTNGIGTAGIVYGVTVDPSSGALANVPGSGFGPGNGPITVSRSGRYVYVGLWDPNGPSGSNVYIAGYAIDATTHALTPTPGSPYRVSANVSVLMPVLLP